jgi:hypothetical protein
MHKLALIAGALAILSTPALAGSANDKPMVLAEETGVSVNIGGREHHDGDRDRDHHRGVVEVHHHHGEEGDHEHHRRLVVVHHHDPEEHHHHRVVVIHRHHGEGEHEVR